MNATALGAIASAMPAVNAAVLAATGPVPNVRVNAPIYVWSATVGGLTMGLGHAVIAIVSAKTTTYPNIVLTDSWKSPSGSLMVSTACERNLTARWG